MFQQKSHLDARIALVVLALASAGISTSGCAAETEDDLVDDGIDESGSAILNGRADSAHAAVASILFDKLATATGKTSTSICTGTLVRPDVVLTAAHCVVSTPAEKLSNFRVAFGPTATTGTRVPVGKITSHPGYVPGTFGSPDVAAILLAQPVTSIKPIPVALGPLPNLVGKKVIEVGFGVTAVNPDGSGTGAGTRRSTVTVVAAQEPNLLRVGDTNGSEGSGSCRGDSGGPTLAGTTSGVVVVGVHSFGRASCQGASASYRTDVAAPFIRGALALSRAPAAAAPPAAGARCSVNVSCKNGSCACTAGPKAGVACSGSSSAGAASCSEVCKVCE